MAKARAIGGSGITVFPVGLGGMPLSIQGRPDRERAMETLKAAFESGIELIDTADVYCLDDDDIGHNERLIAEAVGQYKPDRVFIATKGGLTRPQGRWERDGARAHLLAACDRSLAALGVERIDLYQLHAPDPRVPFEESMGALADLRKAGKIAHVGLSNVTVRQIEAAAAIVPIVSVQNRCNPHDLRAFREGVIAACERMGIAFLPYSPVGGSRGVTALEADPALTATGQRARTSLGRDATAPEIAIAWLLAKSDAMLPIPGASKPQSIRSSCAAADIALSADEVAALDRAFGL